MSKVDQFARGRKKDWHGWAFQFDDGSFGHWAEVIRPATKPSPDGRWLKVRFVPVKPTRKAR